MDEKMSLVEEKLAMEIEKKLAAEANSKKLGMIVKLLSYMVIVLVAAMITKCMY